MSRASLSVFPFFGGGLGVAFGLARAGLFLKWVSSFFLRHPLRASGVGCLALGLDLIFLCFQFFAIWVLIEEEQDRQLLEVIKQVSVKGDSSRHLGGEPRFKSISSVELMHVGPLNQVVKVSAELSLLCCQLWEL